MTKGEPCASTQKQNGPTFSNIFSLSLSRYVFPCGIHTSAYFSAYVSAGNTDCPTCGATVSEMCMYGNPEESDNQQLVGE